MDVVKIVRTTMLNAFVNFAKEANVEPTNIKFYIVPKGVDDFDGKKKINYFYSVSDKIVRNEKEQVLFIPFKKILGVKADVMSKGAIAGNFLKNYFATEAKEMKLEEQSNLRLMLMPFDEKNDNVRIFLYNGSKIHSELTLEDVFGGDEEEAPKSTN